MYFITVLCHYFLAGTEQKSVGILCDLRAPGLEGEILEAKGANGAAGFENESGKRNLSHGAEGREQPLGGWSRVGLGSEG